MVMVHPKTKQEALQLLNQFKYTIMAGGTDLMVQRRRIANTLPVFDDVLFINAITELDYIKDQDEYIEIGALANLEDIMNFKETPTILKEAIRLMASPAIRNVATIPGNIINASPAGDSLVCLYALDATAVIESEHESKEVLVQDIITGVRKTIIKDNEMITKIKIPKQQFHTHRFQKIGGRQADAISKVSFVGLMNETDTITDIRICFGAVNQVVVRDREIESIMIGKRRSEINIDEIVNLYQKHINPINDQRSNIKYRRQVSNNLLKDFLQC